jgi:hypothetical protein
LHSQNLLAFALMSLQELTPATRATAFASQCIQLPNQNTTDAAKNDGMCVLRTTRVSAAR